MPIIKRKRVMRKPKKVIKRKSPIVRKKANPMVKVTNALSNISLYHNKVIGSLFDHLYFGYVHCNEQETNLGAIQLKLDSTTNNSRIFPLHLIDLSQVQSYGTSPSAYYELRMTAGEYPFFQNHGSLLAQGADDGSNFSGSTIINRTVHEWFDVRLELFGRSKLRTKYKVMLLKISDEELNPIFTTAVTTANKHNQFWKHLVRPYYTNTIIPFDRRLGNDFNGKYKILWQKEYEFRDNDNSFDECQRKLVKIFKRVNSVNTYNETPYQRNYLDDDPDSVNIGTSLGSVSSTCQVKNRLYLVIMGSQTEDMNIGTNTYDTGRTVGPAGIDVCSYNLYYRTKHMVPTSLNAN